MESERESDSSKDKGSFRAFGGSIWGRCGKSPLYLGRCVRGCSWMEVAAGGCRGRLGAG